MQWDWYILCLLNFIDIVEIHRASCTKSETFQKLYVQRDRCSSMQCTISFRKWKRFVHPSEFWISIHNERNLPVLDNYDNEVVRISMNSFNLLLKVNELLHIALLVVSASTKMLFLQVPYCRFENLPIKT